MTIESTPSFRFARHGETLTVELGARVVMENRQELKSAIRAALDAGARTLRLRFAPSDAPTFVDSSGWGVLVALARDARRSGAQLVLVDVDPGNLDYLGLTRLADYFTLDRGEPGRIAA